MKVSFVQETDPYLAWEGGRADVRDRDDVLPVSKVISQVLKVKVFFLFSFSAVSLNIMSFTGPHTVPSVLLFQQILLKLNDLSMERAHSYRCREG